MNQANLTGRLAARKGQPVVFVSHTRSGVAIGHFTVACDRNYKDRNGNRPTDFVDCEIFGFGGRNGRQPNNNNVRNLVNYGSNGRLISVNGNIRPTHYQNRQGQWVDRQPVVVSNYSLMGRGNTNVNTNQRQYPQARRNPMASQHRVQDPFASQRNTAGQQQSAQNVRRNTVTNPFAQPKQQQPSNNQQASPAPKQSNSKPMDGADAVKKMSKGGKKIDISDDDLPF